VTAPARRRWLLVGAGAAAALAGIGGALWRERSRGPDPAWWTQPFATPDGGTLRLADFRGGPLLLNFWATWCPPCVREMPELDRFHQAHAGRGWQVLGLAIDGPTPVREFLRRTPVGYPIALGGLDGMRLLRELGNASGALPYSVLFDAGGSVRRQHLGELTPAMLQAWSSAA
jgi:thiol-disulfide isomerase/thioredoxin